LWRSVRRRRLLYVPATPHFLPCTRAKTTRTSQFEGGPKPWLYEPTAFYTSVVPLEPEMVSVPDGFRFRVGGVLTSLFVAQVRVTPNPQGLGIARYSYSVTCLKLGDVKLAIEVSNKPTRTNQHPALANATIDFSCQTPQTVFAFAGTVSPLSMVGGWVCVQSVHLIWSCRLHACEPDGLRGAQAAVSGRPQADPSL
jgi:hypothetical protein